MVQPVRARFEARKQLEILPVVDLDEGQRERSIGICELERLRETEKVFIERARFLDIAHVKSHVCNPQDARPLLSVGE